MDDDGNSESNSKPMRADAQRNIDSLLRAAAEVFDRSGVDAPVKEIADKAGVGVGTLYRHFPQRPDLIKAIIRHDVDACADAASLFATNHPPLEALAAWMQRLVDLVASKRGLAAALYPSNSSYRSLPDYVFSQLTPALRGLLDAASDAGSIRSGVDAHELLLASMRVATSASEGDTEQARRMVALIVDGLRFGATNTGHGA
ncbi:TetR/AcrR family transcriptional regulator [Martelella sp. FLE1502]|tara:strand:+ start:5802 stop:6407 length:606 start_codon:yes stop_codon:yes gene_type:complete